MFVMHQCRGLCLQDNPHCDKRAHLKTKKDPIVYGSLSFPQNILTDYTVFTVALDWILYAVIASALCKLNLLFAIIKWSCFLHLI